MGGLACRAYVVPAHGCKMTPENGLFCGLCCGGTQAQSAVVKCLALVVLPCNIVISSTAMYHCVCGCGGKTCFAVCWNRDRQMQLQCSEKSKLSERAVTPNQLAMFSCAGCELGAVLKAQDTVIVAVLGHACLGVNVLLNSVHGSLKLVMIEHLFFCGLANRC